VVTGILHFAHAEPGVVFAVAAAALGGLAGAISIAIESRGECFGPAGGAAVDVRQPLRAFGILYALQRRVARRALESSRADQPGRSRAPSWCSRKKAQRAVV